jgi:putative chitinase
MKIDRAGFFSRARASVFHGHMEQSQVDGANAILDAFEAAYPNGDVRWIAYMLATAFHETAATMHPIAEFGHGRGRPYGELVDGHIYYGRGYVQLTWRRNYEAMTPITGVNLVSDPDLALRPDIAAKVMMHGMVYGTFTGKKLADYFTPRTTDFLNARRIINGLDCAGLIAGYGRNFLASIGDMV